MFANHPTRALETSDVVTLGPECARSLQPKASIIYFENSPVPDEDVSISKLSKWVSAMTEVAPSQDKQTMSDITSKPGEKPVVDEPTVDERLTSDASGDRDESEKANSPEQGPKMENLQRVESQFEYPPQGQVVVVMIAIIMAIFLVALVCDK